MAKSVTRYRVASVRLTEVEYEALAARGEVLSYVIRDALHRLLYPAMDPLPERRSRVIVWHDGTEGTTWPPLRTVSSGG